MFELFKELYMYDEDINAIEIIAETYYQWCISNKYFSFKYEILDYREKFQTNDVIIIHNLYRDVGENYTISTGNEFLHLIEEILYQYCDTDYYYEYCYDFWIDEINGILND